MDTEHGALCISCIQQILIWSDWLPWSPGPSPGSVVTRHITGHYCHQQTETDSRRSLLILRLRHRGACCVTSDPRENHQAKSGVKLLSNLLSLIFTHMNWAPAGLSKAFPSLCLYTIDITTHQEHTTWTKWKKLRRTLDKSIFLSVFLQSLQCLSCALLIIVYSIHGHRVKSGGRKQYST